MLTPSTTLTLAPASRSAVAPRMGFFDDLKKGFENEPKLAKARDVNAGKSKSTPGYVKKKQQERSKESKQVPGRAEKQGDLGVQTGNERLDELLSGWTWK